jgi:hypothetical protein
MPVFSQRFLLRRSRVMSNAASEGLPDSHQSDDDRSSKVTECGSDRARGNECEDARDVQQQVEMFIRALQGDQCAQDWSQRRFKVVLLAWLKHHPARNIVCSSHNEAYFIDGVFQRIWQRHDPLQFELSTMPALLQYLRASLNGVILGTLRTSKLPETFLLPTNSMQKSAIENVAEPLILWEMIECLLSNERERRLAYLLFHCRLKPADIIQTFPQEFGDIHEIGRLRLTIVKALCKNLPQKGVDRRGEV